MSTQQSQIQFLAHASFRITTPEGHVILIDPWYTNNPALPLGLTIPDKVDLILITHGHRDHLDSLEIHVLQPGEVLDTAVVKARSHK